MPLQDCNCIEQSAQLKDQATVTRYLKKVMAEDAIAPLKKIPTGLFIQSLKFYNSSEVSLTGYLWQRYDYSESNALRLEEGEIGFIFPEQVNSGSDITPIEVYREKTAQGELIGWYFEVTVRQPFDYSKYPFDHKTVWLRIWPKDFTKNIVLTPHLASYKGTGIKDRFAYEKAIVLGSWSHQDTYFNYKLATYDTNFGFLQNLGDTRNDIVGWDKQFPELHMNIVVKRKFENAFVVYLLPLFLITALLFGATLTISSEKKTKDSLGFNAFGFIGATSGLFFVLMLAHIQLRQEFEGTSIVYIEYFYIFMYIFLVLVTANAYLFSIRYKGGKNWIVYRNNLLPKLLFWPIFTCVLVIITYWIM
ncbi:MAG: hypothetical protein CL867_00670 [Cytophagaceae bacterium]|nr:hypothetical protein [Cytophagaceae bacterium]